MKNRVALVTGSTSGIGKATALLLLKQNYQVIVSSSKPEEQVDLSDFSKHDFKYIQIDISKKESINTAVSELRKTYACLDVLVNSAGVLPKPCSIDDITDEVMDKTIGTNLKGTFYCLKYFGKLIQETSSNGSIVNITSVDGIIGEPYGAIYSATKAGIISLTKSFARHYSKPLVRVNAVAPGLVDTPLTTSIGADPLWTTDLSIIKRMGTPEEIAQTISFLASDNSSFTTGQVIAVDGGFTLK